MGEEKEEAWGVAKKDQTTKITGANNTYDKYRQRKTRLEKM